jgi:mRNA-degrading endonuclease RelE of RelBE toxin-antitoxin system
MSRVLVTVVEVDPFPATAARAGLTEKEREAITVFLARDPDAGEVIPGTGGLRKLRWAGKSKGKSGGYRVIYYYVNASVPVYLLAIYPKNQQMDLTPQQKKRISALARVLKTEALTGKRRRR